jgi:imidazolonepropionase-like amidohydrolase
MNMDGWTKEDAAEVMELGLHIGWPRASINTAWWASSTPEEQKKNQAKSRKQLTDLFDKAKNYAAAKAAGTIDKPDIRLESMLPAVNGEMLVFIVAQDYRQIDQALVFAEKYDLKIVIVGGAESWRLTERLLRQNVPVVLRRTQSMPYRQDYDYDMAFKVPRLLQEAGVKYCFSNIGGGPSSWDTRSMPFQAGQAVAFGLSREDALRGVTLSTAEILGVDADLGSLDVGKKATIVVSEGEILDQLTNRVVYEFIEGRPVDLNSRHKELFEKYKRKTLSQQ